MGNGDGTPGTASRYLYLVRHGEATPDGNGLSETGRRQVVLLGRRLRTKPISIVHHGPLPRAAQTALLIGSQLEDVPLRVSDAAGDYVPYVPDRGELPADSADHLLNFVNQASPEERQLGPLLASQAMAQFTGPVPGYADRHEVVVTHNFLIAWLVRHALDAPRWRWLALNHANAALTVIRYAPGRPASVLVYNDTSHLPEELRWTGLPSALQV